jgi:hypothetical protein
LKAQLMRLLNEPDLLKRLTSNIEPERTTSQMVDEIECLYKAACDKRMGSLTKRG